MFAFQVRTCLKSCLWLLLVANLLLCQGQDFTGRFYKIRPDTLKEFQFFKCQGVFDKEQFVVLNRICDDCQNIYRKPSQLMVACKDNCFRNPMFQTCVRSLRLNHQEEEFNKMITYLSGQDL